jgi:Na+ dependent nucleoside transporter N-terminus
MTDLRGVLGLAVILAVAFAFWNNRTRIPWRTVAVGLAIQIGFAVAVRDEESENVIDATARGALNGGRDRRRVRGRRPDLPEAAGLGRSLPSRGSSGCRGTRRRRPGASSAIAGVVAG